jgi:hypothetical protein
MRLANLQIPQKTEWRQANYKDVVRDRHRFIESLPLPVVNYPRIYGTWILFQESEQAQPFLCSCQRDAATGFLRINDQSPFCILGRSQVLVDFFVPPELRHLTGLQASSIDEFAALPFFQSGICHLCNRRVPSIRWSNLDEHSLFVQHLGWYWHYALYAAGVSPHGDLLLGTVDDEIAALVEIDPAEGYRQMRQARDSQRDARVIVETMNRQRQKIHRVVEERLRRSLGFPPHGKTGGSEILLRWIVAALLPARQVLFRHRPEFLGGLELDIYLPELRLAIEYQGEHHYEAFDHLGGERHLRSVVRRDKRKAQLCKQAGVDLRYFTVADKLTEDFVRERLSQYANIAG